MNWLNYYFYRVYGLVNFYRHKRIDLWAKRIKKTSKNAPLVAQK